VKMAAKRLSSEHSLEQIATDGCVMGCVSEVDDRHIGGYLEILQIYKPVFPFWIAREGYLPMVGFGHGIQLRNLRVASTDCRP
jgi:hypothetical protein